MAKIRLNLPSNDTAFLAVSLGYSKALATLELFKSRPDKVPSLDKLTELINLFQLYLEGARNGDRLQIALRNQARKDVTAVLKKIFLFLESMADEDDLIVLQQAGLMLARSPSRKKTKHQAPVATLPGAAEQEVALATAGA